MSRVSYIQCDACKTKNSNELVTITFEKINNKVKEREFYSAPLFSFTSPTIMTSTGVQIGDKSIDLCRKCLAEIPILRAMKI